MSARLLIMNRTEWQIISILSKSQRSHDVLAQSKVDVKLNCSANSLTRPLLERLRSSFITETKLLAAFSNDQKSNIFQTPGKTVKQSVALICHTKHQNLFYHLTRIHYRQSKSI